jgi:cytochrome P450
MGALPHRSIRDLSARYGPLMQLWFGSFPVVVGSSPEMARLLLQTHDAALAGRPRTAAGRHTAYDHSDMLWSPYGAHWRHLRRVCLSELFSASRLASYEHIRVDEVRALLRGLHAAVTSGLSGRGGALVVVREHLFTATLGMISRMVLGRKYVQAGSPSASGMTPEEFTRTMDEFFFLNGALNVGDFVPWLDRLDLQGYVGRMRRVGVTLDSFMERVLDEHTQRRQLDGEGFAASDMVDVLLELDDGDRLERDSVKALTLVRKTLAHD